MDGPPLYLEAISLPGLRSLCEPGVTYHARDISNVQGNAIAEIEGLASTLDWKSLSADHCATDAARFALALRPGDPTDPPARLKAIICRAYGAADRYAAEFAQDVIDGSRAADAAAAIKRALDLLVGPHDCPAGVQFREADGGPLQRSAALAERWRRNGDRRGEAVGREDGLIEALDLIEFIRNVVLRAGELLPGRHGEAGDAPRFFFVLRLAEVLAASTRVRLYYSDHHHKRESNAWGDFVRAALRLTGLDGEDRTIEGLLRRLRDFEHQLDCLSANYDPQRRDSLDRPFHHGEMPSSGLELDYGLSAATSWDAG